LRLSETPTTFEYRCSDRNRDRERENEREREREREREKEMRKRENKIEREAGYVDRSFESRDGSALFPDFS